MKEISKKVLGLLGVNSNELKVIIVCSILESENKKCGRQSLIVKLSKEFDSKEINNELKSLNALEVISWSIKKNVAVVELTPQAEIAYLKVRFGDKIADALLEGTIGVSSLITKMEGDLKLGKERTIGWIAKKLRKISDTLEKK